MSLQPSRRDSAGPPPRNVTDLARIARQARTNLRNLDNGMQDGRFATLEPVGHGPSPIVGGEEGGDSAAYEWQWEDRGTVTRLGTQTIRLTYEPVEESLFVRWHAGGHGGVPITNELFSVEGQTVTIPDPVGIFAVSDAFSFQYQIDPGVEEPLDLEIVGSMRGTSNPTTKELTFDFIAAGITPQPGDFAVIAARGGVAPGGGDITLGLTCGDDRVSSIYAATPPVIEGVWGGFFGDTVTPIVVDIVDNPSYTPGAWGVLAVLRGVNGIGASVADETTGITPQVSGFGAIAVTWAGNTSFTVVNAIPPTGYTNIVNTASDYGATDMSYWFDPDADTSPAGTWTEEGVVIVTLI